jgi:hypothetical protein
MARSLRTQSEDELLAKVREMRASETSTRAAYVAILVEQGAVFDELRSRHLSGEVGPSLSWSVYCRRKLGHTRAEVDECIALSRADDPMAFWNELRRQKRQRLDESTRGSRETRTIIVRRPGVVFGYFSELEDGGKALFLRLLWRTYPKMTRRVGDEVELGGEDEDDRPLA